MDVERFFKTLAGIIGDKHQVSINITVTKKEVNKNDRIDETSKASA